MTKSNNKERKELTYQRALTLFQSYSTFLIADMNNVKALQIQNIKHEWYNEAEFLFGKNTVIKKALLFLAANNIFFNKVYDLVKKNIAFIFTNTDPKQIKESIMRNQRNVHANVGMLSQCDLWVNKGLTDIKVDFTSKFQALNIPTKVTKGCIEIITDCLILSKGQIVQPSQQDLLKMLHVKPFIFKVEILNFCEESHIYDDWVVDMNQEMACVSLRNVVEKLKAISLGAKILTEVSVPYELVNVYRNTLAISLASGYQIKENGN